MRQRSFKAKILLFGEYTIILGAHALAVPVPLFAGQWKYGPRPADSGGLEDFAAFLHELKKQGKLLSDLNTLSFLRELEKGLYFESSIPQGYGAGSSGALCAAVYERFVKKKSLDTSQGALLALKNQLAQIEQYFHGSSSGTDPLVSYLEEAILIEGKQVRICSLPDSETGPGVLFLLNTGMARKTAPLVRIFLEKCKKEDYKKQCEEILGPLNEKAIQAFLNRDQEYLANYFSAISEFQFQFFQEMTPPAFRGIWQKGFESELYKLKLCGAGGGGFIIGMTKNLQRVKEEIPDYEIVELIRC